MDIEKSLEFMKAVSDMANALNTYYNELVQSGFTEEQALALTINLQTCMLSGQISAAE